METKPFLDQVRVASPCRARWETMHGDDRVRFCDQCRKYVYDLSALTGAEAGALIRRPEGSLCARLHRRADGRILTRDCPVGRWRRRAGSLAAGLTTVLLLGTLAAVGVGRREGGPVSPFRQKIDGWIYEVKLKLGMIKPTVVMGEICVTLPAPAPSPVAPAVNQ
ncbi:MAG TPA: hypothetical protein VFV96_07310 [Verrucomicrobiae bacterium]|nr:hypothetical protein [Verrucomicrobiae bacterium]